MKKRQIKKTGDDAKVTWAFSKDASKAPKTIMSGKCPEMGLAYGWFAPKGTTAPSEANVGTSADAYITK